MNRVAKLVSHSDGTDDDDAVEAGLAQEGDIGGDPPLEPLEELFGEVWADVGLDDGAEGGPDQVGLGPTIGNRIHDQLLLFLL